MYSLYKKKINTHSIKSWWYKNTNSDHIFYIKPVKLLSKPIKQIVAAFKKIRAKSTNSSPSARGAACHTFRHFKAP